MKECVRENERKTHTQTKTGRQTENRQTKEQTNI